jgi:DNA-binding PadR family transcriptional regulator
MAKPIESYLPLSEATYYIMLALADEPLHGYGIMQKVENLTGGTITLGPGTLYGVFSTLEKEELIRKVNEVERRKVYSLTERGKALLQGQIERLQQMTRLGQSVQSYLQ